MDRFTSVQTREGTLPLQAVPCVTLGGPQGMKS
jgi:hypothetical protein